jgi:hypothetical protein
MSWDTIVADVLPILLLIGFWLVLMRRVGQSRYGNPTADKLEEIRVELEGIRRALERDPFSKR